MTVRKQAGHPVDVRKEAGHPLGVHRVLDSEPRLPQAAERLDNRLPIYSNELLIEVERLNLDAASFVQMEEETLGDLKKIGDIILRNTREIGKQQNRVTGSGGMLFGKVKTVGKDFPKKPKVAVGDSIASLVSLTLTPLHLDEIISIDKKTHQARVRGHAILFEKSLWALMPEDLKESVATAVFDVAGAPATVYSLCRPKHTVVILGAGGKAGVLSTLAARKKLGKSGKLIGIEPSPKAAEALRALKLCDEVLEVNAKDPIALCSALTKLTRGKMADIVVNVAPVPDTEMSSLLCANPKGKIFFFGMATQFSKVVLGAEGVASTAQLLFGNGYYPGHSSFCLKLLREAPHVRSLFETRYG